MNELRKDSNDSPIDFVVTWVDGSDKEWQNKRAEYEGCDGDKSIIRFRDLGIFRYWFRGVEQYTPWVHKVYLVTNGQIPSWLNLKNRKLQLITHEQIISSEHLPTFSSHPIELNIHKIPGLSDKFVYFNDDTFIINPMLKSDFFHGELPCDYAVLSPLIPCEDIENIALNDLKYINMKFSIHKCIRRNMNKWFSFKYDVGVLRNLLFMLWPAFIGFRGQHMPNAYLKKTFYDVWNEFGDILTDTCSHRFRDIRDVNHWIMQYWQICSGEFYPYKKKGLYIDLDCYKSLMNIFKCKKYKMLCLNDMDVDNYAEAKQYAYNAFANKFPSKSSFEI